MVRYTLDAKKRGIDISEHLYGLFFEDINQSADGGLNAEMVINNSFEFEYFSYDDYNCESTVEARKQKNFYWDIYGAGPKSITTKGGMNENNPSYLLLNVGGNYHLENPGYYTNGAYDAYGMPVDNGETYLFSMWIKRLGFKGVAKVFIRGAHGRHTTIGEIKIPEGTEGDWIKVSTSVVAEKDTMGRLCIVLEGNGKLGIDYASLLPSKTWGDPNKYRNGKLNPKLVQVLKDGHPSFMRFPGGCVVEGDVDFEYQYKWRTTVGALEQRKQIPNVWRYMQSYGIGFYEYFALCEDIGATPLPVLHCGVLCQIRMGEQRQTGYQRIVPGTKKFQEEVIDNVADLIYFAKGDVSSSDPKESHWAKVRADMGHPEPFELHYIGIGNENWGYEYFDNFASCLLGVKQYIYKGRMTNLLELFNITVVSTSGVDIRPQDSNESWKTINEKYRDMIVDEHVYNSYQWFIDNTKRYDCYDRGGAKVFMGEYAMHTMSDGRGRLNGDNNLKSALSEAAFLTGCERNSDVVRMTCYAPLFASSYHYRWTPDMIWFNARDVMLTPNYYVQQMFAANTGKYTLTGVSEVNDDNAGGLLVGGHRTASAVSKIIVKDIKTGKEIYSHDFKDGLGGWKVYPNCRGGHIENGELIIEESDAFNGYYYDAQKFGDCEVEISFRRLSGEQSFIAGVGVADVRDAGTMDSAGFSICCQYGKNHKGYDVSFDKRVDFIRTVCEMMGKDKFLGYSPEGNKLKLVYTKKTFTASIYKDGAWHEVLFKKVRKVNERISPSTTVGEDG
ncbi:MAG: hypothetical protein K2N22_03925, partial [Clostridia bacterium]|nr:hypothetical protein [Clostridia bacterium]